MRNNIAGLGALLLILLAHPAMAGLRIATDIAPVASLAAMVAAPDDVIEVVIPGAESPHDFALRPSHLRMISAADVVIHAGPQVSAALARAAGGADATVLDLADEGREAHGHEEKGAEETGHRHDDHGHGEEPEGHHDAEEGARHDHHADSHAWLNPDEAAEWVNRIAEALAAARPDEAEGYRQRADSARADLAALGAGIADRLAQVGTRGVPGTGHAAFAAFTEAFGLEPFPALADQEDSPPGAARMAAFRDGLASGAIACLWADGPGAERLLAPLAAEYGVPLVRVDILGATLEPGATLYASMMEALAESLATCGARE